MQIENSYHGSCFCGAVELWVVGKPAAMGYCHCASCREWSAGPVNAFTLWAPSAVSITRGAEQVGSYRKTERSTRKWCRACGGHVLTEHPAWGVTDVYAAVLGDFPFEPALHVNYAESVLRLRDGLPKLKDVGRDGRLRARGSGVGPSAELAVTLRGPAARVTVAGGTHAFANERPDEVASIIRTHLA
jgi:hypothetical protein